MYLLPWGQVFAPVGVALYPPLQPLERSGHERAEPRVPLAARVAVAVHVAIVVVSLIRPELDLGALDLVTLKPITDNIKLEYKKTFGGFNEIYLVFLFCFSPTDPADLCCCTNQKKQ